MRLTLGYMEREQELSVLTGTDTNTAVAALTPLVTAEDTEAVKQEITQVAVAPEVAGYLMDLVAATRADSRIRIGVSTRGALALYAASQASAALAGRNYVMPEDIKAMAPSVLAHRLVVAGSARISESETLIRELAETVRVPLE